MDYAKLAYQKPAGVPPVVINSVYTIARRSFGVGLSILILDVQRDQTTQGTKEVHALRSYIYGNHGQRFV